MTAGNRHHSQNGGPLGQNTTTRHGYQYPGYRHSQTPADADRGTLAQEQILRQTTGAVIPPEMAGAKTWRGEGFCALIGTDDHRLKYAQRNLASTEKVLIGAASGVNRSVAALQSHQQILRTSLVRMRAASFQPKYWMNGEETTAKLEAQLQLISQALSSATKLQAQLMYKSVDIVGPFGLDKDYTQPQIDELTNATLETYVQQLDTIDKLPEDHPKGWWDATDPATWIPHGWKPNDTQKWCRYARMATEEGHGLVPYYGIPHSEIGWDPNDPLTWVPFGWHVKDPSLW